MNPIMYILPELFISLLLMTLLMVGVFINKSFKLVNFLTIIGLIFSVVLLFNQPEETQKSCSRVHYKMQTKTSN